MKIQATIGGFHGEPCTMISLLDERTGIIVISKTIKYRENRYAPDFALVSNLDLPELDMSFTDELLRDSIRSYFTRKAQLTLDVLTEVRRYEPDNCIERDTVDEGGRRYRINADINNGQVAILATIALVESQSSFAAAVDMANELADFYRAETI